MSNCSINICATSGLITANAYEICAGDSATLSIDSYNGVLQWQSFDGTMWVDETGTGSTSDTYTIYPFRHECTGEQKLFQKLFACLF
ncbi:MAG: hypothetical protein IPI23_21980 [Bacteroidetes bacterium]|nr:hypothetical protein [Bacteroidota bacterium]